MQSHHAKYKSLFKKTVKVGKQEKIVPQTLKPKHHNMVHYAFCIKNSGFLKGLWCMRLEANHKKHKNYMNEITNRKNVTWTLALKCSLQFSNFILNFDNNLEKLQFNGILKDLTRLLSSTTEVNFKNVLCSDIMSFRGIDYNPNTYLAVKTENSFELFKTVTYILHDGKPFAICYIIEIKHFSNHFQCYAINETNSDIICKAIEEFTSPPSTYFFLCIEKINKK